MATVIDALMVTLGLDGSGFTKGSKQVEIGQKNISAGAKRMGNDVANSGKQMGESLRSVRNELLAFIGLLAGANSLKNFVVNTISANAALERTSRNLGTSSKELAMWQLANEKAGGSIEGMTAQIRESSDAIAAFKNGQGMSSGMEWLARYGGMTNAALKDGNGYLLARADAIKRVRDSQGEAAGLLAAKNMGITDDTYNLIKNGASALQLLRHEQEKLAEQQAKNGPEAEKMRQKWNDLTHQFEAMAIKVMPQLIPVLEKLSNWLITAIPKIESFVSGVNSALEPIGGLKTVIEGLIGLKIAAFTMNLIGLADALGKVGSASGILSKLGFLGAAGAAGYATGTSLNHIIDWATYKLTGGKNSSLGEYIYDKGHANDDGAVTSAGVDAARARMRASRAGNLPRGMRNNNPGNIKYGSWARQHGATGSDGTFAIFPTMAIGQAAQQALLSGYLAGGSNTIRKVISKYAPTSENNTKAYIDAVAKKLGIGADDALSASQLPALADAISRHENGAAWDSRNVLAAANLPMASPVSSRASGASTSQTDVKINTITINTKATDATGIAHDIRGAVNDAMLTANANTGVS
jgi:hypothetical protein